MTLQEIKNKFLEIIRKQNNLEGRVLDDLSEATETYVEIFGIYPDCYYGSCHPDRNKTVEKISERYECFFPGKYDFYKDDSGKLEYEKIIYDCNIITEKGFVCIDSSGITVYTNDIKFKDDVFKCYTKISEENPCEVYWVSNGQGGFRASKLKLKDGKFNVKTHYNDDFDYDKVNNFVNDDESGLIILHGIPGSGKDTCRVIKELIILLQVKNGKDYRLIPW